MKTQVEIEKTLKNLKPILDKRYHIDKIGYFGSFASGEQKKKSDIDILVFFRETPGWDFFDLQDLLEKELELKVDLVSEKALKKQLRESILKNVRYV